MNSSIVLGIFLVVAAGLGTGGSGWPMKVIRKLKFEHYWFIGMLPLIIIPWIAVFVSVENVRAALSDIGWQPLIISNLFATGWGFANVLAGLCAVRVGFTLSGAILTGISTTVTVTVPMVFKGTGIFSDSPGIFSLSGFLVLTGVAITLFAVYLSVRAGFGRERIIKQNGGIACGFTGGFLVGLILTVIAGVLAMGQSFAFVYSQGPIIAVMKNYGAGEVSANFAFWAVGLLGGALINILYPAIIMTKNHSWGTLVAYPREVLLAILIGSQLITAFAIQGIGMITLGALGASVGTGIKQAFQIISGQGVGFISGEWKGVGGKPRAQMIYAIILLIVAVAVMVYARLV